jgi:hypothetical protein
MKVLLGPRHHRLQGQQVQLGGGGGTRTEGERRRRKKGKGAGEADGGGGRELTFSSIFPLRSRSQAPCRARSDPSSPAVQCMQCSAVHAVQCSAVECTAMQCSAVQCSDILPSTTGQRGKGVVGQAEPLQLGVGGAPGSQRGQGADLGAVQWPWKSRTGLVAVTGSVQWPTAPPARSNSHRIQDHNCILWVLESTGGAVGPRTRPT